MAILKSLIAASVVGCAHAFWRMECPGRVGIARMDPIVNPGDLSSHVHSIHGSSAFDLSADTASLLDGDCTSCRVTQDKSAYWTPAMYFKDASTGQFEAVEQIGGMLAYYLLNGEDIKTFPANFQMIAGDTKRRTFSDGDPLRTSTLSLAGKTQKQLEERAIGFNCLNYAIQPEATLYRQSMPEKEYLDANCKDGLRLELMFPSCWDGKNVASDDHKSHVAYPDSIMSGTCPDSHPVRLPGLLFETIWATEAFEGRDGMFVMSNGDPTGFGYHGDFIMGWEEDFLQKAVDTCTNDSGRIQDCPIFNIVDESKAKECEMKTPLRLLTEQVLEGLSALPGDVQITYDENAAAPKPKPKPKPTTSSAAAVLPGAVFKESSAGPAPTTSSVVAAAVAPPPAPTTTSSPPPPPPPPPAPTTTSAPPIDPNVSYESTQYITNGDVVTKILWDEEVVWETLLVDATTTITVQGPPPPTAVPEPGAAVRRHLHAHNHHRL